MSQLAIDADVSVGQIYRLFKDKNDVILAIATDSSMLKGDELEQLAESVRQGAIPVREGFVQLSTLALSGTEESLSFEILAEAFRNPGVADRIADLCGRYRSVIRKMANLTNPTLSEHHLDGAEEVLLGLMFGLGHRTLSRPRLSIAETANQTADMIMAALTVAATPRSPPNAAAGNPKEALDNCSH